MSFGRKQLIRCMLKWVNGLRCLTNKNVKGCLMMHTAKSLHVTLNSVSHLAEILKQAIENEQQLLQEIKIPHKELQIDMVSDYSMCCLSYIYIY